MAKRPSQLPTPPSNPYGAHPGAGWAAPAWGARKKRAVAGWVIGMCVGSLLVFVYVLIPAFQLLR
jgi:hypothetical protein